MGDSDDVTLEQPDPESETERLFLFEVFIGKIKFNSLLEPPKKRFVLIDAKLGELIDLEIKTDLARTEILKKSDSKPQFIVDFNCGKSLLFSSKPNELKATLEDNPLMIFVKTRCTSIGQVSVCLCQPIIDLAENSKNVDGYIKPTEIREFFPIVADNCRCTYKCKCREEAMKARYDAMKSDTSPRTSISPRSSKSFRGSKTAEDVTADMRRSKGSKTFDEDLIRNTFDGARDSVGGSPRQSEVKHSFEADVPPEKTYGRIEICVRLTPLGSKVATDFQVETTRTYENKCIFKCANGVTLACQKFGVGTCSDTIPSFPFFLSQDINDVGDLTLRDDLTAETLNRYLCKNPDCPAVHKFKEYGIGPLATCGTLGTVYDSNIDPPTTYALSHTYGTMEHYGPYGFYRRPKQVDQPFVKHKQVNDYTTKFQPNDSDDLSVESEFVPLRLKGGATSKEREEPIKLHVDNDETPFLPPMTLYVSLMKDFDDLLNTFNEVVGSHYLNKHTTRTRKYSNALALRGGPLRLRGGTNEEELFPTPMMACKSLMEDFDKLLNAYKKALGPCGQATCPHSPNIMAETCRKTCDEEKGTNGRLSSVQEASHRSSSLRESTTVRSSSLKESMRSSSIKESARSSSLKEPNVDNNTEKSFQMTQIKAACGSPVCPYTKKRAGLPDDDLDLNAKSCLNPSCTLDIKPKLPPLEPIHWDCPDPLPKGECRNPECPYRPPDTANLRLAMKPPCGTPSCPYAPPPPCEGPICPFANPKQCPFTTLPNPCPFSGPPPLLCDYPGCPLSIMPAPYGVPVLRVTPEEEEPPQETCPWASTTKPAICGIMNCPYAPVETTCGEPDCPYAPKPPECCPPKPPPCCPPKPPECCPPKAKPAPQPVCSVEDCPYNKITMPQPIQTSCSNPECPFNLAKEKSISIVCSNQDCPYNTDKKQMSNVCSNPDCPLNKQKTMGNVCSNPDCPFNAEKNQVTTICSNPACPFAPLDIEDEICENPECPFAPVESPCGNPDCQFVTQKNSYCGNPDCPYAPKETCWSPVCPFRKRMEEERKRKEQQRNLCPGCSVDEVESYTNGKVVCAECKKPIEDDEKEIRISEEDAELKDLKGFSDTRRRSTRSAPTLGESSKQQLPGLSQSEKGLIKSKKKSSSSTRNLRKKSHKKKKGKFVYSLGQDYPGVQIGHKMCNMPLPKIPPDMGWAWNIWTPCARLKPRRGWRPGAIGRSIFDRIQEHRLAKGLGIGPTLDVTGRESKLLKLNRYETQSDITVSPKPTLHVKKQDGTYFITMNPLKDPKTLAHNESPYMDCTPMQFKITRNKEKKEKAQSKQGDEAEGEWKTCLCDGEEELEDLESSDSELDIEFTPPAGIIRPERLKKDPHLVHTDTQYEPGDFSIVKAEKQGDETKNGNGNGKNGKNGNGKGGKKGKGGKGKKK